MQRNPMDSIDQRSAAAAGRYQASPARIGLGALAALVAGSAGFAGTTLTTSLLLTGPLAPYHALRQTFWPPLPAAWPVLRWRPG